MTSPLRLAAATWRSAADGIDVSHARSIVKDMVGAIRDSWDEAGETARMSRSERERFAGTDRPD